MSRQDYTQPSTSRMSLSINENTNAGPFDMKSQYVELLNLAENLGNECSLSEECKKMHIILEKVHDLFPAKDTEQMFLDAKLLKSSSEQLELITSNLDLGESKFNSLAFAEQFRSKSLDRDDNPSWEILARAAEPVVFNTLPYWSPLLGAFEFSFEESISQQRKVRQHRTRDQVTELKEPEKVKHISKTQQSVEEMVQHVYKILRKCYKNNNHQPINYFKFVINPNSFSATVENIFHVSFLVNDKLVKLELGDDDEAVILPLKRREDYTTGNSGSNSKNSQNIFSIDKKSWQRLCDEMELTEAIIQY